jgi:hypothetical protein
MNYTALEAIGSLLGGAASVISLIGILFAVTEVRRARKIVDRETDYRIYDMMLDLDRFFIEHPDLRPYVYSGKRLPDTTTEGTQEHERVMAAVEMVVDFMECAYTQFDLMPIHQRIGWIDYMIDIGKNSPLICELLDREREWYMGSFVHLVLTGEFDPRLDKWDAHKEWRRINKAHWRNRLRDRIRSGT